MLAYYGMYIALPLLLSCLALFMLFMRFVPMKLGNLSWKASGTVQIILFIVSAAPAAYLFYKMYLFGSLDGYFYTSNSRAFKNETLAMLLHVQKKYNDISEIESGHSPDEEKDIRKNLQFSIDKLKGYKRIHLSTPAKAKLEGVVFNETAKLKEVVDAENFYFDEFAAAVKKVRFCAEERFIGIKAYKGEAGYAFISYSHRNTKVVTGVIKHLQEAGLNIWFDEGITEGEDWMDHLAKKIDGCANFVMFQTVPYVRSNNCNVEIKRALKSGRTIIRLILEDSNLPEGIEMYLDALQAIDCRDGIDDKLEKIVSLLREGSGPKPAPAAKAVPAAKTEKPAAKKTMKAASDAPPITDN